MPLHSSKLAIIDPVGIKAGMNCYDLGLLDALSSKGIETFSFSNFTDKDFMTVHQRKDFLFKKKSTLTNTINFIYAHLIAVFTCKKRKVNWVILHMFSATPKDFFSFKIIKLFKLNIIAIIHDIESLSNEDNQRFRKKMYNMANVLIVHNITSYKNILPLISEKNRKKLRVIPHGNYTAFISAQHTFKTSALPFSFEPSYKYLLFFGQIKPVKGLDILLKAISFLPEDYKLIIAGRPHRDDFERYEKIINELNINNRIIKIIRFITDEERDYLFKNADALILPYRKIFQSGVLLLSMSYGLPIIASDLPANQEIIQHKETGLLFKDGNSNDLAEKIIDLFSGDFFQKIRQCSFKIANDQFSWLKIADSYINILN